MNRILIIESDLRLAERMCRTLMDIETHTFICGTLEAAAVLLEKESYQLVITDTEFPDGDGNDLIYRLGLGIYQTKSPRILLIMPNDRKPDMAELREQGIADYITKPFNMVVLKAKVWTQFKRGKKEYGFRAISRFEAIGAGSRKSVIGEHIVGIDDYLFNFDTGEYSVAGKKVRLSRVEQCLLRNLVENKGIVLKKKALVDKIKSESRIYIDEMALAETVGTLSDKLGARNYVKTVYGIGYLWAVEEDKNKSG